MAYQYKECATKEAIKHTVDPIYRRGGVLLLLLLCPLLCLLLAEGHLSLYSCELLAQLEDFGIGFWAARLLEFIVSLLPT